MSSSLITKAVSAALIGAAAVSAHGHTYGINVAGEWYDGYDPTSYPYMAKPPTVVGWKAVDPDTGFVAPAAYASGAITCHNEAVPAGGYAAAQAGDKVQVYWTPWPASHRGPVIDMLANCHGDCTTVNKTNLEFFKIAAAGLVAPDDAMTAPGTWATDTLIAHNNSWTIQIPADLAAGNYVWRHEIIALHSAEDSDGAQNYPQCFNLAVSGTGALAPGGTPGEKLYKETEAGIKVDIYRKLDAYDIPGPPMIAAGTNLVQTGLAITGRSEATTTGVGYSGVEASVSATAAALTSKTATSKHVTSKSATSKYMASEVPTSKAVTSKAATSSYATAASSAAHSTASVAAVAVTISATFSAYAMPTEALNPNAGKSCHNRRHARGFKA